MSTYRSNAYKNLTDHIVANSTVYATIDTSICLVTANATTLSETVKSTGKIILRLDDDNLYFSTNQGWWRLGSVANSANEVLQTANTFDFETNYA